MQDVSGVHLYLILMKAYRAVTERALTSIRHSELGESDFRVLEVLLHKGAMPVNTIGPKVFLTPGSISVAVDRLFEKGLVTRMDGEQDRRVRMVDLAPAGRKLIQRVFDDHAVELESIASALTKAERTQLARILKKLGKHAASV